MNFLKEAHSAFDFAKYYPLLTKAVADNDSTTPGYTYEEISKISFLSHPHRVHLVDFLLTRLPSLGWAGKQKVIRILLHLCKKGHFEMRILLRQRDGDLRKAASLGGPPDPVLANTPQLFFNSAIQELLSYIFDSSVMKLDEEILQKGGIERESAGPAVGYGSSGEGKFDGFGNTPKYKHDSIVDQVYEIVGKVVTPEASKREHLEGFLKGDKGNYQPFILSSNIPIPTAVSNAEGFNQQSTAVPPLYKSVIAPKNKGHVAGRVGGGWDSDEEEEEETMAEKLSSISPILPVHVDEDKGPCDHFLRTLLKEHPTWPVDYEAFGLKCKSCTVYVSYDLVKQIIREVSIHLKELASNSLIVGEDNEEQKTASLKADHNILILLLFIEYCLNEDILSVNILSYHLPPTLREVFNHALTSKSVKMKSKKIRLLLKLLS